jgi:hypothetical protein
MEFEGSSPSPQNPRHCNLLRTSSIQFTYFVSLYFFCHIARYKEKVEKVKLSLNLTKHHAMKTYGGVKV